MQRKYGSVHVHFRYSCLPILSNRQSEIQELVRKSFVCTRLFVDASERHFLGEGCQSTTPVWHLAAKCTLDPHKKRPNFVANPMLPKYSKANKSMKIFLKMGAILLFWLKGRSKINLTGMLWPTCVWFQRESTIIFTLSVLALWIQKMKIWRRHF